LKLNPAKSELKTIVGALPFVGELPPPLELVVLVLVAF
jgi:hypothetical protein